MLILQPTTTRVHSQRIGLSSDRRNWQARRRLSPPLIPHHTVCLLHPTQSLTGGDPQILQHFRSWHLSDMARRPSGRPPTALNLRVHTLREPIAMQPKANLLCSHRVLSVMTPQGLWTGSNTWPFSDRRAYGPCPMHRQNRSQCRGDLVRSRLLVDRELKVRKRRQPLFHAENAQARDQRAGRKRGDGDARKRRRAHACQTGAGIDDLPRSVPCH